MQHAQKLMPFRLSVTAISVVVGSFTAVLAVSFGPDWLIVPTVVAYWAAFVD